MSKVKTKRREGARLIGYARISTAEQSIEMQVQALVRAGVHEDDIYHEQVSGVSSKRFQLDLAVQAALPGDTLVVWKLDRVGRSLLDLLGRLDDLEKKGIKFKSLTEGIDTQTPGGRLIMHVMGSLAQFERDLVVERTKSGVQAFIARGGKPGQPSIISGDKLEEAKLMIQNGAPVAAVAAHFEVAPNTIYNRVGRSEIKLLREQASQLKD